MFVDINNKIILFKESASFVNSQDDIDDLLNQFGNENLTYDKIINQAEDVDIIMAYTSVLIKKIFNITDQKVLKYLSMNVLEDIINNNKSINESLELNNLKKFIISIDHKLQKINRSEK